MYGLAKEFSDHYFRKSYEYRGKNPETQIGQAGPLQVNFTHTKVS